MPSRPGLVRLAGFVVMPVAGVLVPLAALPAIGSLGPATLLGVLYAQSVGAAGAVVVELGWGLSGTQRVARQTAGNTRQLVALSTLTKLATAVPVLIVASVVMLLFAPSKEPAYLVIAASGILTSVNVTWVLIGFARPWTVFAVDTVPRAIATVVAATAIWLGGSLWWYAGAMLAATTVSAVAGLMVLRVERAHFARFRTRHVVRALRSQSRALSGRSISALYIALPITLVTAVAPSAVAESFAAAERMQRMALTGLQAFPNWMQARVGRIVDPARRRRAAVRSIWMNTSVGAVAGAVFTLLAPWGSTFVFAGAVELTLAQSALGGILILIVSTSRAVGSIALVAVDRIEGVAWSALLGAVIGVPLLLMLPVTLGAPGGQVAEVIAEVAVLGVQIGFLTGAMRVRRRRGGM
jgi:hypothetical protein